MTEIERSMADVSGSEEQPRKRIKLAANEQEERSQPTSNAEIDTSSEGLVQAQLRQERKFGIQAFASSEPGFSAIVKQRYTDFLVNEISLSGQVLHLDASAIFEREEAVSATKSNEKPAPVTEPQTTSNEPVVQEPITNGQSESAAAPTVKESEAKNGKEDEQEKDEDKNENGHTTSDEDVATLESIFGQKTTQAMQSLYGKILAKPDKKARDFPTLRSDPITDKQQRTNAHVAVRNIFQGRIETTTDEDNVIVIKAVPPQKGKKNARWEPRGGSGPKVKGKVGWDELGGEHLHFTLYKENKDTMEALFFIASQLKMHIKNFQMAGTKDRRAVTVQRISTYRTMADRIRSLNPRLRQARVGGFSYQAKGLDLGDLQGNEFTITLRDCHAPGVEGQDAEQRLDLVRQTVSKAMDSFSTRGFINYFGLQRFGSFATSTDDIGKRMLQGDLKGAVDGILAFAPAVLAEAQNPSGTVKISADDLARAEALHIWRTGGKSGTALDKLPRRFQAENSIIRHLSWTDRKSDRQRNTEDWQGALTQIARNLRLMYVHAYQSLVWNSAAGRRWEEYGNNVVEGDLIIIQEHAAATANGAQDELEDVDDAGEVIIRPTVEDSAAAPDEKFERARPLSKAEAESGRFSMFDIVLPLPGFDVVYPANTVGAFYKEFMAKDRLNPYDMRRKWKDISLSGGYRKVMSRPNHVSYEVKNYGQDDEQLVETDLERLFKETEVVGKDGTEQADGMDVDKRSGGSNVAVVLKMQLGSSQYATMALRELTKGGALMYKPDYQGGR